MDINSFINSLSADELMRMRSKTSSELDREVLRRRQVMASIGAKARSDVSDKYFFLYQGERYSLKKNIEGDKVARLFKRLFESSKDKTGIVRDKTIFKSKGPIIVHKIGKIKHYLNINETQFDNKKQIIEAIITSKGLEKK
jgi:hypothetical protein